MTRIFQAISRFLANYTSAFIIAVAVFAFFTPHTFDWVRGTTQTVIPGISVTCLAFIVGGVISTVHDDLVSRGLILFL